MSLFRYFANKRRAKRLAEKKARTEIIVGPFCYIVGHRHPAPFSKTGKGAARRAERKHKQRIREEALS